MDTRVKLDGTLVSKNRTKGRIWLEYLKPAAAEILGYTLASCKHLICYYFRQEERKSSFLSQQKSDVLNVKV